MEQMPLFAPLSLSVSDLTHYLRQLLESDDVLRDVWVQGEISNISRPSSGHIYFTLKDQAAALKGVIWRTNALRHFMWQALLTARFGLDAARTIAAAQEAGTPAHQDSAIDAHNNVVGQEYGAAHVKELTSGSTSQALARLVPVAMEKWESDELVWVRPH